MIRIFIYIISSAAIFYLASCNLFYVGMRNVPVFFTPPREVPNKIKDPIKDDVKLSALWVGHSTVLLQMYDKVILTDPVLTETIGELGRRVVEPGIEVKNLPKVDNIIISHSHFDHLSLGTLEILEESSKNAAFIFPEGIEKFLPDYDLNLIRMKNADGYRKDYIGESKIINDIKITTVFAQHWGGRYVVDGYIWGDNGYTGYMLEYKDLCVFFAGDTGYESNAFKFLGSKFDIDLALIPIGPCAECEQPGTRNHVFPPESIQVFKDLNAKFMIPIHYATFYFAQADPDLPLSIFNAYAASNSLQDKIFALRIGGQKIIEYK